jgi:5-methylcytosine-specific restriction endonuclease McrA
MDISPENWVRFNFSYICSLYMGRYPLPVASGYKPKPSKKERKAKRLLASKSLRKALRIAPIKAAGIDVTTADFLSSYKWRKLRMEALIKYGRKCMCCGATPDTGVVINVDHIKPRKLFPSLALDINNLQILCHECNHGKGNWNQTDWRK